ncbi:MAG TPA: hypothetical protein VGM90_29215 [Kofleriaceae bacterium]|jgi:hypothetical protein
MRSSSLISMLVVAAGCTVRVPGNVGIPVQVSTRVEVNAQVNASTTLVPLQGARVNEFFGVPLDGAQDVVFVLDVSGSMQEAATGRAAMLAQPDPGTPITPPGSYGAPPGTYGPAGGPPPTGAPPPPPAYVDPSVPRGYDPNAPQQGYDPNAPRQSAPQQVTGPSTKIQVAQTELVDALKRIPSGTRMDIVFFNDTIEAFAPNLVPLDDVTRDGLINYVKVTVPVGSTALSDALRVAFLMNPQRIVLLSDGLGNVGGGSDSILRDAREAIHGGVRIDTIGLGFGQDASLLGALAHDSGGLYQQL